MGGFNDGVYADVWINTHANGTRHIVRYRQYSLATFNRMADALAYRDWFWSRRGAFPEYIGGFTLEDLISARHTRKGDTK